MKVKLAFQELFCVFVNSQAHQTAWPESGFSAAHSGGIFSTIQRLIPLEEKYVFFLKVREPAMVCSLPPTRFFFKKNIPFPPSSILDFK